MTTDLLNIEELNDQRDNNDLELRDLVYQALQRDGLLTSLKAQLRAAVFKTIEKASKPAIEESSTPSYDTRNGRVIRGLILDWLEHSHLLYTKDLLEVETPIGKGLDRESLIRDLHLQSSDSSSCSLIEILLRKNSDQPQISTSLPEHIRESIDTTFPSEKINDIARVRQHFRTLFNSIFDPVVLDAHINKAIPSSFSSIPKYEYEQICLKWIQSCSQVSRIPSKPIHFVNTTNSIGKQNSPITKQACRKISTDSDSSTSSDSTSTSHKNERDIMDVLFPNSSTPTIKILDHKLPEITPPQLPNFDKQSKDDDDDDETTSSIFSRRNATAATLDRLKKIEGIADGNETPRTRSTFHTLGNVGAKDLLIEYDDESFSQSQMSSVDDVTVEKASEIASVPIDYLEDF